jgi:hypothetical protein
MRYGPLLQRLVVEEAARVAMVGVWGKEGVVGGKRDCWGGN